jgi:hypothetical protein
MRTHQRLVAALTAMSIAAVALSFAQGISPSDKNDEKDVLQADMARFDAMVRADVTALDKLLAAEAMLIQSNARIDDKEAFIYEIKSGSTKYLKIIPTERKVRLTGTVAIVYGVAAMRAVERKENLDITVRYIGVHVKRDGRWQLVSWQATRLIPSDKVIPGLPA